MEIRKFLDEKEHDPVKYDFTNDGACEKYRNEKDVLERYFIYTICTSGKNDYASRNENVKNKIVEIKQKYEYEEVEGEKKHKKIKDPDSYSPHVQEIYRKLWPIDDPISCCITTICGDTLNSCHTALNVAMEKVDKVTENNQLTIWQNRIGKRQAYSKNYSIALYALHGKEFTNLLKKLKYLEDFISVYHTIGNFMPVPKGCNGPRGEGVTKDFWDLALKIIYEYYLGINNNIVKIVGEDKTEDYRKWLNKFGKGQKGWKNFIKTNFLEPFVESNYGKPLELWHGHFARFEELLKGKKKTGKDDESYVLPDINQVEQYFKNACDRIRDRGNLMVKALKKQFRRGRCPHCPERKRRGMIYENLCYQRHSRGCGRV